MAKNCPACGHDIPEPLATLLSYCRTHAETGRRRMDVCKKLDVSAGTRRYYEKRERTIQKWEDWVSALEDVIAKAAEHDAEKAKESTA